MKTFEGWYCAHCQRGVDASEVTFYEQHTVCGRTITDDTPLVDGPVAWMVDYGDGSDPEVYDGERPPGVAAECSMTPLYPASVKAERDALREQLRQLEQRDFQELTRANERIAELEARVRTEAPAELAELLDRLSPPGHGIALKGDPTQTFHTGHDVYLAQRVKAWLHNQDPAPAAPESVTVRYDLSPAQTESAIRDALIRMGWTPPEDESAATVKAERDALHARIAELEAENHALVDALELARGEIAHYFKEIRHLGGSWEVKRVLDRVDQVLDAYLSHGDAQPQEPGNE